MLTHRWAAVVAVPYWKEMRPSSYRNRLHRDPIGRRLVELGVTPLDREGPPVTDPTGGGVGVYRTP